MLLVRWLSPISTHVARSALIRIEPGERADVEAMARLLDRDEGYSGLISRLVAVGSEQPDVGPYAAQADRPVSEQELWVEVQADFPSAEELREHVRWYACTIHRA